MHDISISKAATVILVGLSLDETVVMSLESDSKYIMIPMYGAAKINDHVNHNEITIHVFIGAKLIQPFSSVTSKLSASLSNKLNAV